MQRLKRWVESIGIAAIMVVAMLGTAIEKGGEQSVFAAGVSAVPIAEWDSVQNVVRFTPLTVVATPEVVASTDSAYTFVASFPYMSDSRKSDSLIADFALKHSAPPAPDSTGIDGRKEVSALVSAAGKVASRT